MKEYSEGQDWESVRSIQDVVMKGSGQQNFTKGETYRTRVNERGSLEALNDHDEWHVIKNDQNDDEWFNKFFIVVGNLNEAYDRAMGIL